MASEDVVCIYISCINEELMTGSMVLIIYLQICYRPEAAGGMLAPQRNDLEDARGSG